MGYELHITRAAFWAENEGHRITQAEWLHLIEQDTELVIDGQNGPFFAVWGPTSPNYSPWLDWSEGNIYTKSPDRKTLAKMLHIADQLGATVQGDEGEVYVSLDDYPGSVDIDPTKIGADVGHDTGLPLPLKRERFWNRLEYIIVGLIVLAYVLYDLARG